MSTPTSQRAALPISVSRFASTIFCDDVRLEASGKLLIVGMYNDVMAFEAFPQNLSLKMIVTVVTPADHPFDRLAFRVYSGKRVVFSEVISDEALGKVSDGDDGERDSMPNYGNDHADIVPIRQFRLFFSIGPFEVAEESALLVRVETESETLAAGALALQSVTSAPPHH